MSSDCFARLLKDLAARRAINVREELVVGCWHKSHLRSRLRRAHRATAFMIAIQIAPKSLRLVVGNVSAQRDPADTFPGALQLP